MEIICSKFNFIELLSEYLSSLHYLDSIHHLLYKRCVEII